jgi:hypothetical protein
VAFTPVQGKSGLACITSLWTTIPVSGPQAEDHEVRPWMMRRIGKAIDSAKNLFPGPASYLVTVGTVGKPCLNRLGCGKVASLMIRNLAQGYIIFPKGGSIHEVGLPLI